jgi:transposase
MNDTTHIDELLRRLDRIESALAELLVQRTVKEWYSTAEVAEILDRAEYTVREWCRQARIRAKKKPCGRGKGGEWLVSHDELTRLKNEGLLPLDSASSVGVS